MEGWIIAFVCPACLAQFPHADDQDPNPTLRFGMRPVVVGLGCVDDLVLEGYDLIPTDDEDGVCSCSAPTSGRRAARFARPIAASSPAATTVRTALRRKRGTDAVADLVLDDANRPKQAILDAEECAYLVPVLRLVLLQRQADPTWKMPSPIKAALARLVVVAGAWRPDMSAEMSADGHEGVTPEPTDLILDTKQIAEALGKSDRQARRWCERNGTEVAGRWTAHRSDVEKAS